ncbi:MAG: prolyl oligopeptidase family serine peptidase [Bacteroidales bacterium]|nr:prolyl oligopeptidase family serine peptidase [Bacteroidales bacterium]
MIHIALLLVAGILATHPEGNPNARLLTVAESVGQGERSVYPEQVPLFWTADSQLTKERPKRERPQWKLPTPEGPGIVYGQSVSRNEFGISGGVFPAPDGKRLAVYRKDESAVTQYPLFNITTRTGEAMLIRYPMAGMASEHVSVCVTDLEGKILSTLQVEDLDDERYLAGVTWSPDSKYIFVQVINRAQNWMNLNMYRADDGRYVRTILSESNDAWVEPLDPLYFLQGRYDFIYRTDNRDGYRSLYLCDTLCRITRITPVDADVEYVANDGNYVYYTSAEVSPIENHLFRIRLNGRKTVGKPQRLTPEEGWHQVTMSPDCSQFIDRYSSLNVPGVTQVRNADGSFREMILTALDPLDEYAQCRVELGTTPSADGQFDNYYRLFYPRGFDPSKKYPLIVYVYGGPHSQMVNNSWLGNIRMWEMLMAQRGYVVYVQDNRGTSNRGAAFEKAINRQCGTAEAADQMAGIQALLDRAPWIDRTRIGVHGWSYGGFMTLTLSTRNPGFFKVAVAGGPVIDWQWYEVMYGERYMDTPETNPEGYARSSLIARAKDLTGRVLICQGLQDGTVVPQHSLSFVQACIEAGIPVDWFPYPLDEHNMRGKARVHLYEKITDYFETYL